MTAVETGLFVLHTLLGAIWLGAMTYSLTVVQPKVDRFFAGDDDGQEAFLALIAAGNRWRVVGLIAALAVSGAALWWLSGRDDGAVQAVRVVALAAAAGIFWYVSWRHWPARVFAVGAERDVLRRRLRLLAGTMTALVGVMFVLGLAVAT